MTDDSGRESREPGRADESPLAPCSDGGCILRTAPARGQVTNGGCRHLKMMEPAELRMLLRRVAIDRRKLAEERDAAYAQGALDMRTRAAAVLRTAPRAGGVLVPLDASNVVARFADDIEALDVKVPQ